MCAVQDFTGKWGYFSLDDDSLTIPCIYHDVCDFSKGKAFVKDKNNKWCNVNKYNEAIGKEADN